MNFQTEEEKYKSYPGTEKLFHPEPFNFKRDISTVERQIKTMKNLSVDNLIPALLKYRDIKYNKVIEIFPANPMDVIADIVYDHYAFKDIFKYLDEDENPDDGNLYNTSFYITSLFQGDYGYGGFCISRTLVMCRTCLRGVQPGDICPDCVPRRVPTSEMSYRTDNCYCLWKRGEPEPICKLCAEEGKAGNRHLIHLTKDLPYHLLVPEKLKCYKSVAWCGLLHSSRNLGFLCVRCADLFNVQLPISQKLHVISRICLQETCLRCNHRVTVRLTIQDCGKCARSYRREIENIILYGMAVISRP